MAFLTEHVANRLVSLAEYLKYLSLPRCCFSTEEVVPTEGGFYVFLKRKCGRGSPYSEGGFYVDIDE
jgi:hypothetical protein